MTNETKPDKSEFRMFGTGTTIKVPYCPPGDEAPAKAPSNKAELIGVGVVVTLLAAVGAANALGWF